MKNEYSPIYMLDRVCVVIEKKTPYLNWIRNLPDPDLETSLEDLNREPSCYLIPNYEVSGDELEEYLQEMSIEVFEQEMASWWTEENDWEQDLSWENFSRWFGFKFISMVVDLGKHEIERVEM